MRDSYSHTTTTTEIIVYELFLSTLYEEYLYAMKMKIECFIRRFVGIKYVT